MSNILNQIKDLFIWIIVFWSVAVHSFFQGIGLLLLNHFLLGKSRVHVLTFPPNNHLLSFFFVFVPSTQSTHRSVFVLVLPLALCRHFDWNNFSICLPFPTCFAALASFPYWEGLRHFTSVCLNSIT